MTTTVDIRRQKVNAASLGGSHTDSNHLRTILLCHEVYRVTKQTHHNPPSRRLEFSATLLCLHQTSRICNVHVFLGCQYFYSMCHIALSEDPVLFLVHFNLARQQGWQVAMDQLLEWAQSGCQTHAPWSTHNECNHYSLCEKKKFPVSIPI